jgi:hypothetical protein
MVTEPSVVTAPPPLPQPLTNVSELLQTEMATIPLVAMQQEAIQSLLANPLYSNQLLQSLQEHLLLQQRQQQEEQQLRVVVQQQQQQQQPGQTSQRKQQANLNQALFLQSVLSMVQQQQQQPVQQQQQQQLAAAQPQVSPIASSLSTAVNTQMFLPLPSQPGLLLQQAQNVALLQYLSSQQRIDGAGTGTSTRAESSNVIGDQYSSSSVVGNADGKEEERELSRPDDNDNANNKKHGIQSHETR